MVDEPGGWELKRALEQQRTDIRDSFAQLNARLDKLVTTEAFAAEQRRVDDKFRDMAKSIGEAKASSVDAMNDERQARKDGDAAQQKLIDKLVGNIRWIAVSIVIPIALFVANIYLARGGQT